MKSLPRLFQGPWAWLAGGSLTLVGVAGLATFSGSPRDNGSSESRPADPPVNWIADPGQYPPALLRLPTQLTPAALDFGPSTIGELSLMAGRKLTANAAGFDGREEVPAGELRSVLRRLPEIETLAANGANEPAAPRRQDSYEFSVAARPAPLRRLPPPEESEARAPAWQPLPNDLSAQDLDPPTSVGPSAEVGKQVGPASQPVLDGPGRPSYNPAAAGGGFQAETAAPLSQHSPEAQLEPTPAAMLPVPTSPADLVAPEASLAEPASSEAIRAVADRAKELSRHGFSLAQRRAYYSARAEFVQALRLISQALDTQRGDTLHSQALANGLRALEEADDFVPKGTNLEADLNVAGVVVTHQTPVLKSGTNQVTPLVAVQQYYTYAQEQLAVAGGNQPAASEALFGLGKLHLSLAKESVDARRLGGPKAMTLHQAALLVDPRNHRAANELGVLLARYGQLADARRVLLVSLSASRQREAWHNLAVVHERLGETDLAGRARYEEQLLASGVSVAQNGDSMVRWVNAKEFAATSHVPDNAAPASAPHIAAATKPAEKKSSKSFWPWNTVKR